jgi:hypothetical protein
MKKAILSVAAVLALAVTLVSCGGGSPKASAEKWLNGFYHMDYASAKEVSTDETKKQLESFESMMGMMQQNAKDEAKKIKVDIKDPKVEGDNATVEYTLSNDPSPKTLKMVKQNGKWLAQWSKMDMGGMGDGTGAGAGTGADMNNGGMGAGPDTMMAPPADGTGNMSSGTVDTATR